MKRLLASIALLVAPLGCVGNQGASIVRFLGARAIKPDCSTSSDQYTSSGKLDLVSGTSLLIVLSVETNNVPQPLSVGQISYSGPGLGDTNLYEVVYTYEFDGANPGITLPKEESLPIYAVYRPQADPTTNTLGLDAIGPQALAALRAYFQANPARSDPTLPGGATYNSATVVAHIKAKGYLSGSQEVESNVFRFPVTVFYSDIAGTCKVPVGSPRCGRVGQDGPAC